MTRWQVEQIARRLRAIADDRSGDRHLVESLRSAADALEAQEHRIDDLVGQVLWWERSNPPS